MVGVRTGVLTVRTDSLAAMVVFLDREPVDGLAVRGDVRVVGPEALDEIEAAPLDRVTVTEVAAQVARELGSYFLPTEIRDLPANLVVAEDLVRSLARPGRRGCVIVRTPDELGLVFIAGGRVELAYREHGATGGLEEVAELLQAPGATLWARLGPDARESLAASEARPLEEAVTAHVPPTPAANPGGLSPPGSVAPGAPAMTLLDVVMGEVRGIIGPNAVRVEGAFQRAEPSVEGLRAAAESLRARRLRLLSPATVGLVADRVVAALERCAGGGNGG